MRGDKQMLDVYLGTTLIANISIIQDELHWAYSKHWMETGYAVSPYLPFIAEIPSINVQRFLKNLLPEGSALEELVSNFHISKNNIFALIQKLGLDTPGSLMMVNADEPLPKLPYFRLITDLELTYRLDNRDHFGLIIWDGKPRLSVAGIQDKISVVLNKQGELGFGEGLLCSTHILKFEKQKYSHLVLNEYLSMRLAKACGLTVAEVQLKRFGQHPALLIKRFDRKLESDGFVKRRHLIDGCQAFNLPPEYKYEQNFGNSRDVAHIRDGVSLAKLYQFANDCINPAITKLQILDWVLFNLLIFNSDAHGKNISFFMDAEGISLAPFYDLVNIKMYPEFEHSLAMALGDEFNENHIYAYQLADFADSCQLSRFLVVKQLRQLVKKLKINLEQEIKLLVLNNEEQAYLKRYQSWIIQRADHLLDQSQYIVATEL